MNGDAFAHTRCSFQALSQARKVALRPFRLHYLEAYQHINLEPDFLRRATLHWVPELHVFRFSPGVEMCPMVEEFAAIIDIRDLSWQLYPNLALDTRKAAISNLCSYMGVTGSLAQSWRAGDLMSINFFFDYLVNRRFPPSEDTLLRGLCICLLSSTFLVQDSFCFDPLMDDVAS